MSLETMTKLATYTVGAGGVLDITFNNIPQTYTDLYVVMSLRTDRNFINDEPCMQFNDVATGYSQRWLTSNGSAASSSSSGPNAYFINWLSIPGSVATSGTFSSTTMYIPNYSGNSIKSISAESVLETNSATTGNIDAFAAVWNNTAPIKKLYIFPRVGPNFVQYSTVTLYGVKNRTKSLSNAKPVITGGTLTSDSQYFYRTFTSSGTLSISGGPLDADVLVIAGGGAGGASVSAGYYGGGGGAGGVLLHTLRNLTGNHTVLIGAGGAYPLANRRGLKGGNSVFGVCTPSIGGGGGGGGSDQFDLVYSEQNGGDGGSGGGGQADANASYSVPKGVGGSGVSGQGNNGGNGSGVFAVEPQAGGGGGGAGGTGGNGSGAATGGAGGVGTSTYSSWGLATSTGQLSSGTYYYAGGGGGASNGTGGAAGLGGGGAGGGNFGTNGTANTGGGAGNGRVGGSGLVIVRYTKTQV